MKIYTHFFVFLFLFSSSQLVFGQEDKKLDSVLEVYKNQSEDTLKLSTLNTLFQLTKNSNPTISRTYAKEHIALAKSLKNPKQLAQANYNYGSCFQIAGSYDSANIYFKKAKRFWETSKNLKKSIAVNVDFAKSEYYLGRGKNALKILNSNIILIDSIGGDVKLKGDSYKAIGNIYQSFSDLELALKYFIKAEKLYGQIGDSLSQATALDDIGYVEGLQGNFQKMIDIMRRIAKVYEKSDDKYLLARSYQSIAAGHSQLEQKDSAQFYYEKGLKIAIKAGLTRSQASFYEHLGGIKVVAKEFEEGIALMKKSYEIHKSMNDLRALSLTTLNLGSAYRDMEDWNTALYYYNECESIGKKLDGAKSFRVFKYKSFCYENLGQFDKALEEYKKFKAITDEVMSEKKIKEIELLRTQFETEKKEQQLALQQKDIAVLEKEVQINNQQKLLLGGGLGLSLVALGFGFYGFRQKAKRNQLEKEKVDAELAFKKKELTTHALHLAKKNEVLESVKLKAKALKEKEGASGYQELIKTINFDQQDDNNWESFTQYFEQVHKDFASNIKKKYPEVTKNELRFMALIKMNMSSKEIASILNISTDGIKKARQRLRKKMQLSPQDSLENTVLNI